MDSFSASQLESYRKDFPNLDYCLNELLFACLIFYQNSLFILFDEKKHLLPLITDRLEKSHTILFPDVYQQALKKFRFLREGTLRNCFDGLISDGVLFRTGKHEYTKFQM